MRTTLPAYSIMIEGRVRRSCGSLELQTAQSHPSCGTPIEVPLPSTVSVAFMRVPSCSSSAGSRGDSGLRWARQRVGYFHVGHAHFVEAVLQEGFFGRGKIALGFFREKSERVDGLPRAEDIHTRLLPLLMHQSQLQHRGHVERGQKALEGHLEFFDRAAAEFDT